MPLSSDSRAPSADPAHWRTGTLFAFFMVAASLLFYRLYDPHVSTTRDLTLALLHLGLITAASLGARQLPRTCSHSWNILHTEK